MLNNSRSMTLVVALALRLRSKVAGPTRRLIICAAVIAVLAILNPSANAQATGACCLIGSGICVPGITPAACFNLGGLYQGNGSSCACVSCVAPEVGACCMGSGCTTTNFFLCSQGGGVFQGMGTCCTPNPCVAPCLGDIAPAGGNGTVDVDDLLAVINAWGPCPAPPAACPANIINTGTSNNRVDVDDLLAVIGNWGPCP